MKIFKKPRLCDLKTEFESELNITWEHEHPDPQMRRDNWISLCGAWHLAVRDKNDVSTELGTVIVPYPPESRISGICRQLQKNEKYIYQRTFSLPGHFDNKRIILHFEAVDQIAQVYLNNDYLGMHSGGYTSFSFDITEYLTENNTLRVEVTDRLDKSLPYGKQKKSGEECGIHR